MKAIFAWLKALFTRSPELPKPEPVQEKDSDEKKRPVNPAYLYIKSLVGKGEHDSAFMKWLSSKWYLVGLKHYKTIIGSSFAWCALIVVVAQSEVGQKYIASAAAKRHAQSGIAIDWKKDGIPRGALMHLDHDCDCKGDSNHVTFADGDCTAEDLKKNGATVPGFGGNQNNRIKRTDYPVCEICAVRWPTEVEKPGPVTVSVDCAPGKSTKETTR